MEPTVVLITPSVQTVPARLDHFAGTPATYRISESPLYPIAGASQLVIELRASRLDSTTPKASAVLTAPTGPGPWDLDLTSAQWNQPLGTLETKDFWLVIYTTTATELQVLYTAIVHLAWHNASLTAPVPPNAALALTKAQADLLYTALGSSAPTLTTARTIALTGDVTYTSPPFNGSANVTAAATLASTGVTATTYGGASAIPVITVDSKGRIISASNASPTYSASALTGSTLASGITASSLTSAAGGAFASGAFTAAFDPASPGPIGATTPSTATFLSQSLAGQNLTGTQATSLVDLAATWNTTGTPTAIKLNVTATAANAASKLLDLQTGGISRMSILAAGNVGIGTTTTVAKLDIAETWNAAPITVAGASGNGTTVTLTFATQAAVIPVGSTIVVANIGPSGYNGTFVVTASTLTSVSYLNATTASYASVGTIERLFTSVKLNVTDTASNATSNLMDLQVGGASKFTVGKTGAITTTAGLTINGSILQSSGNIIPSASLILDYFNQDVKLSRDATGTLAQRNGLNAQVFRVYNSCDSTPATNYDRGFFGFVSNDLRIGSEIGGTYGTPRDVRLMRNGAVQLILAAGGLTANTHLIFNTDGVYDIGASGANRPSNINVASAVRAQYLTLTTALGVVQGYFQGQSAGVVALTDSTGGNFGRLQLGGTTSAFPAIKRNGAGIDIKLADDSAFAPVKGKITTDTAYTATVVAATGYITIYDSTGTAYRVPCAV